MKHETHLLGFLALMAMTSAHAALGVSYGPVPNLRIEGNVGFIGVSQPLSGSSCAGRVWVDMTTEAGRAAYATAMMAFAMEKNVYIRADDTSSQTAGACKMYDVYLTQ